MIPDLFREKIWGWLDNGNYRTIASAAAIFVPVGPVDAGDSSQRISQSTHPLTLYKPAPANSQPIEL